MAMQDCGDAQTAAVEKVLTTLSREDMPVSEQTEEQFERCFRAVKTGEDASRVADERNYLGKQK